MIKEILNISNISKKIYRDLVLDHVSLNIGSGEVVGLIGENGAGKSSLVKTITGDMKADQGTLYIDGQKAEIKDTFDAQRQGIYCISQSDVLLETMTVAENLLYLRTMNTFTLLSEKKANALTAMYLKEKRVSVSPGMLVRDLSKFERKRLEYLKILLNNPRIIIFDEAFLLFDNDQLSWFYEEIRAAAEQGCAFLIVSQNINAVLEICDKIAVMQDGRIVQIVNGNDTYLTSLFATLRREDVRIEAQQETKANAGAGERVLFASGIRGKKCHNATFSLHAGEVLGIYSNITSVPEDIVDLLSGRERVVSGKLTISEQHLHSTEAGISVNTDVWFISERYNGLFQEESVIENITFFAMRKISGLLFRSLRMEKLAARELAEEWGFSAEQLHFSVSSLSVGEKRKLAFITGIAAGAKIFILDNIMPEVDYKSRLIIYRKINELKNKGYSFLFISYDFEDVRLISDRILYVLDHEISEKWFY